MPLTTVRPNPVPFPNSFVVKNGSKILGTVSAGIPWPVSITFSCDVIVVGTQPYIQPASFRHGMSGIHHKINEHLAHLIDIGVNRRDIFVACQLGMNIVARKPFLEYFQTVVHNLLQIHGPPLRSPAAGKGQQLVHHPGNTLHLTDDRSRARSSLVLLRPLHQIFGSTHNHIHGCPNFMCHAGSNCS